MSDLKETIPDTNDNLLNINQINWKEFACGWGAGFVNICIVHPVNKLLFRQMLHGVNAKNAIFQLHGEGLLFLYRGMLPPLFQKTFTISLMFGIYEEVTRRLEEQGINHYAAAAVGGVTSGLSELTLLPFERIQTLLCDYRYHNLLKNMGHAVVIIRKEHGFGEFFRGGVPFLLRVAPTNALFFIAKDELQCNSLIKIDSPLYRMIFEFTKGALIGSMLSCLFYPFTVVKITMQSKLGGSFENPFRVLVGIYRQRGCRLRYVFRGVPTNLVRAFISWGIMNAAYEAIRRLIY